MLEKVMSHELLHDDHAVIWRKNCTRCYLWAVRSKDERADG